MGIIWQVLRKSFVFQGRASRKEYWCFYLFCLVLQTCCATVDFKLISPALEYTVFPITLVSVLVLFFPSLAVMVRRFHDTNRSGWYWLIGLIPLVGFILQIIALAQAGTKGDNDYGPAPSATLSAV